MHVILPAGTIAQHLLDLVTRYLELHNNPLITQPLIDRKVAFEAKVGRARVALAAYAELCRQCAAQDINPPKFTGYTAEDMAQWRPVSDKFELADAMQLVFAMVEDWVNHQMHWTRQSTCDVITNQKLNVLFPLWDDERAVKASQHFHIHVLEKAFDMVQQVVQQFLPEKTWNMWYVSKWGRDMTIEKGEDYRILDWQRRMESGEWTMSSIPPNPAEDSDNFQDINNHALACLPEDYRELEKWVKQTIPGRSVKGHGTPKRQSDVETHIVDDPREAPKVIFGELPEGFSMEGYRG